MGRISSLSGPFSTDPTSNWVARQGGLPPYIRKQARLLMRDHGMPEDEAIPAGIRAVKRWSETGQTKSGKDLDPRVKTLADEAWSEFEAKAAAARAESAAKNRRR